MTKQEEILILEAEIAEIREAMGEEWCELMDAVIHRMNLCNKLEKEISNSKKFAKTLILHK
jgi:hypothetical protein